MRTRPRTLSSFAVNYASHVPLLDRVYRILCMVHDRFAKSRMIDNLVVDFYIEKIDETFYRKKEKKIPISLYINCSIYKFSLTLFMDAYEILKFSNYITIYSREIVDRFTREYKSSLLSISISLSSSSNLNANRIIGLVFSSSSSHSVEIHS